jgi:hypothetical protein
MAGRAIAAVGVVLAFVCIWVDSLPGASYWSGDGTTGAFVLALAILALLGFALGVGSMAGAANDLLLAAGGILLGFYLFPPALFAFGHLDFPKAGTWLALAAGVVIVGGVTLSAVTEDRVKETPAGPSLTALVTGAGIVLVFPGIFLDASTDGESYWSLFGHVGHLLLIVAIVSALAWGARIAGVRLWGLDWTLMLVLLGLVSFIPVGAAFGDFGTLDAGAWLAFAGGILAAGGTWAARGTDIPAAKR